MPILESTLVFLIIAVMAIQAWLLESDKRFMQLADWKKMAIRLVSLATVIAVSWLAYKSH